MSVNLLQRVKEGYNLPKEVNRLMKKFEGGVLTNNEKDSCIKIMDKIDDTGTFPEWFGIVSYHFAHPIECIIKPHVYYIKKYFGLTNFKNNNH